MNWNPPTRAVRLYHQQGKKPNDRALFPLHYCQYPKSYGMFCRHQLVVLFDVGIENWEVLKKCIHRRWYLDNSTSQTIPPANNDNEDNNTVVIEKPMTKKERLKEFNANTKVLKDLCTNDPKSFNESMKVVRDLIANLQLQVSNDASNSSVLVANPDVVVGGRQKRHEGSIPYAPSTSSYHYHHKHIHYTNQIKLFFLIHLRHFVFQ